MVKYDSPFGVVFELLWGLSQARKEAVDNSLLHATVIVGITGTEAFLNDPPVFFPTRSGIHLSDDGPPPYPVPKVSQVTLAHGG